MSGLLKELKDISHYRGMPTDFKSSIATTSITGETVQLYYYNSGVLTVDAGQAAGTVVVAKLANNRIKNALGDVDGSYQDTSFAFTTGTILTTLVRFPWEKVEQMDTSTGTAKADIITTGFSNGEYCIDHLTGTIYGKKATTGTSDTGAYIIDTAQTSGSAGTSDVNLAEVAGTTTSVNNGDADNGTQRVVEANSGTSFVFDSDGDNTAQAIKAAAGELFDITVYNPNTSVVFVQIFNVAAGSVTVGTTVPDYVIPVLAEGGTIKDWAKGASFDTAITYACTTTATGNGDPTTGLTLSATYR